MKQQEKNQRSREKILNCARQEFAESGFGQSSINSICTVGGIAKGVLYHYFTGKDELYLLCIQDCFDSLTAYLKEHLPKTSDSIPEQLDRYFNARMEFFHENPAMQSLFCEAVINPPNHLRSEIEKVRKPFDRYTISLLNSILAHASLRSDFTRNEVTDTFRHYQDFVNARMKTELSQMSAKKRESVCHKAMLVLLYGVIQEERK